jgi:hypothetical protein
MGIMADISHFFALMKYLLDNIDDVENFCDDFLWRMTHDALGSSPRGMAVVLDMILKTQ